MERKDEMKIHMRFFALNHEVTHFGVAKWHALCFLLASYQNLCEDALIV